MNFNFDATLKLGDLLTIISFIGIAFATYVGIRERLNTGHHIMNALNKEIEAIKETLKMNATTLALVATQKVEIDHIKQDLFELKHGQGFVLPFPPQKTP